MLFLFVALKRMFKAATIKDIARALGISPSTVSRALRDSYEIGAETKQKVLDYARQINYHGNPVAQSLRNKRSNSIGVLVADVANSFFAQAINGIESVAYQNGYNIIISQSHEEYEREKANMQHLASRSVDGLLMSVSAQTTDYTHIHELHRQGLPIVFFDRILNEIETHRVSSDNFKTSYNATSLLISKGFKNIALLASTPQISITTERVNGYKQALTDNNISIDENYIKYCYQGGRNDIEVAEAIKTLFDNDKKPGALFIASDLISTASIRALKSIKYPENLAIVGYSNADVIDLLSPGISYIRQPAFEMGQIATQMLIKLIESKYPVYEFETRLLDAEIIWQ
ncbi:LacI family transcriptional regulator [Mucilaginibacter sp. UR6-1]|uniref:LacI family DNA-binding transcriptional regulator n=1 Tax=Mucilaginibacter sp. UR6-1 TaxID=1435643 RepID=UPI001E2934B6|nr:LacI family DNA-binding transcriptional regulator [Mucilaginibacter sp. UR6-1]MCC8408403.1 LacI family transcriptional regulator [Mucilaginibacter sp. UR6-1]